MNSQVQIKEILNTFWFCVLNLFFSSNEIIIKLKWKIINYNELAPEVLMHMDHSYTADYFAIGVLTYELMMGIVYLSNK